MRVQAPDDERTLTVTLDGREVAARAGDTILQVAQRAGIPIPTLCWLDGVSLWGGCRLCVVQVNDWPRPMAACGTPVMDGMRVVTDSPELRTHRRRVLELHLAEGNHICSVCVANGECELQTLVSELDVDHVEVGYRWPLYAIDATHTRFVFDANRCILCTRCVRVCAEVEGAHVWNIVNRGAASELRPGDGAGWGSATACTACGKCVSVCPTGALFAKGTAAGERHHDPDMIPALVEGRRQAAGGAA